MLTIAEMGEGVSNIMETLLTYFMDGSRDLAHRAQVLSTH